MKLRQTIQNATLFCLSVIVVGIYLTLYGHFQKMLLLLPCLMVHILTEQLEICSWKLLYLAKINPVIDVCLKVPEMFRLA